MTIYLVLLISHRYTEYKDALSLLTESGSADSHSDSNPFEVTNNNVISE